MSKNKKRKGVTSQPKKSLKKMLYLSNDEYLAFVHTAKKILRLLGLSEDILEQFTKNQKQDLFKTIFVPPRVRVEKNSHVPSGVLKPIRKYVYDTLKDTYVGDKSFDISYYDMLTMGIAFFMRLENCKELPPFTTNYDLVVKMRDAIRASKYQESYTEHINEIVSYCCVYCSKLNFRQYTFTIGWEAYNGGLEMGCCVRIISHEADKIYFTYQKKTRSAFRIKLCIPNSKEPLLAKIPYSAIEPGCKIDINLKGYVQPHALQRMKMRVDTKERYASEMATFYAIMRGEIITFNNHKYIVCRYQEVDANNKVVEPIIGYFPFTVQGDCLFILTFLPLTSPSCPEGAKLTKLLNITKEDAAYFGMDKLSFFKTTDFDDVPRLRDALKEAGIWHLTKLKENNEEMFQVKKSAPLKSFFEKSIQTDEEDYEEMSGELPT